MIVVRGSRPWWGERRSDSLGYQPIASTPSGPMAAEAVSDAVMADVRVLAAEHGFSGPELALDNLGDRLVIAPPDAEAMEQALARAMERCRHRGRGGRPRPHDGPPPALRAA